MSTRIARARTGASERRTIAAVTTARSDYGILRPVLRAIAADPALRLQLVVGGAHLDPRYGETVTDIEADGFAIEARVPVALDSDASDAVATATAAALTGFTRALRTLAPDLLLLLGDRFETHAAAFAALPLGIPVAHIGGGESTEGAIDDALRHSITKLSHVHFVSTETYRRRLVRMGEEPWRVRRTGSPALDTLRDTTVLSREKLATEIGIPLDPSPLLVTFHPVTLELDRSGAHLVALLEAVDKVRRPAVFTYPGADPGSRAVIEEIERYADTRPDVFVCRHLGTRWYVSLMRHAAAMVGNSSSGIMEAPSLKLPVVNVGSRQAGRVRGANVIDVAPTRDAIVRGIRRALSPSFRAGLRASGNPYGDGRAAARIVPTLGTVPLGEALLRKRFHDG